MKRYLFVAALLGAAVGMGSEQRNPVLVELFTSEGCSSCPAADALLEQLDRQQPIAEALVVVLSEHVDYWNHDGWIDPFSSPAFTYRQEQYARRFGISGPYTPQMVVDGAVEFVGNDSRQAGDAIRSSARQEKIAVRLVPPASGRATVHLEAGAFPAGKHRKAGVWVAFAENSGSSNVLRGENRGRSLHHVAIVRDLRQVGSVSDRSGCTIDVPVSRGARVIAFVQEAGNGRVWGVAEASLPPAAGVQ